MPAAGTLVPEARAAWRTGLEQPMKKREGGINNGKRKLENGTGINRTAGAKGIKPANGLPAGRWRAGGCESGESPEQPGYPMPGDARPNAAARPAARASGGERRSNVAKRRPPAMPGEVARSAQANARAMAPGRRGQRNAWN